MNPLRIAFNWVQYRRTLSELNNLSNETLNDIGVSRYQIAISLPARSAENEPCAMPEAPPTRRRFRFRL